MKTRCNQFSDTCKNTRYQYDKKYRLKNCCRKALMEILDKIPYIMEGTDWWLEFGTLLGFIRENKIIDWDNDLDVGVTEESFTEEKLNDIKQKCSEFNFTLFHKEEEGLYKIIYGPKNYLFCDIWIFRRLENGIMDAVSSATSAIHEEYFTINKDTLNINNKTYFIPKNTSEFLTARYGPDWEQPIQSKRSLRDGRLIKAAPIPLNRIENSPKDVLARYDKK